MALVYKTFKFQGDISQLDDKALRDEILHTCRQIESDNEERYKAALQKRKQAQALIDEILPARARNRGYVPTVKKPESVMKAYKSLMRQYAKWLEKQEQRAKYRDYKRRSKEAVEELEKAGYVAGEHYSSTRALTTKRELLYEIEPGVYGNRMLPEPGKIHQRES